MNCKIVKKDLLGVQISATTYDEVVDLVLSAATSRQALCVTALDVHGLSRAAKTSSFRNIINSFDIVTPDGHSLRWGLNMIHNTKLKDRVAGPDLTLHLCARAAETVCPIFLYGSHDYVVRAFAENLLEMSPGLRVAGIHPSRFRPSTPEEDQEDINLIRNSGAQLVLVGLGCPLQEYWVHEHAEILSMPLLAVGAAFDFISGNRPRAPNWMRNAGLEWTFRMATEPGRLIKRLIPAVTYTFCGLLRQRLGCWSKQTQ